MRIFIKKSMTNIEKINKILKKSLNCILENFNIVWQQY